MKKQTKPAAKKTDKQRIAEAKQVFSYSAFLKDKGVKINDAQLLKAAEATLA